MKNRVAVLKLLHGGYLTKELRDSFPGGTPVEMYWNDMCLFLSATRKFDRNDLLWGSSIEMLPKRKKHSPLSPEEVQRLIFDVTASRLLWEAEKYERMAEGTLVQAAHYQKQAKDFRAKAKELREKYEQTRQV